MRPALHLHRSRWAALAVLLALVPLNACSGLSPGPAPTGPTSLSTSEPSEDEEETSPDPSPDESDDTASPEPSPSATSGSPSASPSPTSTEPVTCNTVTPARLGRTTADARRTTEVVTVVSDGRNLTTGTSEQTEFLTPMIRGPLSTQISDPATMAAVAKLIEDSTKNRILLERPESPTARADISRRPFNAPGTHAMYNASSPLTADVVVVCGGQEQRWTFTGEGNPSTGIVNCAVEPARSNIVARLVYQTSC
jgi:hypothetical protein